MLKLLLRRSCRVPSLPQAPALPAGCSLGTAPLTCPPFPCWQGAFPALGWGWIPRTDHSGVDPHPQSSTGSHLELSFVQMPWEGMEQLGRADGCWCPSSFPAPCQGPLCLLDPSGIPNQGRQLKGGTTWKKKKEKINCGCLCLRRRRRREGDTRSLVPARAGSERALLRVRQRTGVLGTRGDFVPSSGGSGVREHPEAAQSLCGAFQLLPHPPTPERNSIRAGMDETRTDPRPEKRVV